MSIKILTGGQIIIISVDDYNSGKISKNYLDDILAKYYLYKFDQESLVNLINFYNLFLTYL